MSAPLTGFAADLGGTKIAAARLEAGVVVERVQAPTDGAAGPEAQVAAIGALLARLGHTRGAPLGVAVAGRIDGAGAWHAVNTGTLPAILGYPLERELTRTLGRARCLNDAAAAGYGEALLGAGRDSDSFAYLTVSTGIGGGLVIGKRLIASGNGLAGHVGFVSNPHASGPCGSGRVATVESVAAGRAIAAAAAEAGHGGDARAVFEAAAEGADWAERIVARSAGAVATLIGDLAATLGLDTVALGGSIGLAPGYLVRVERALAGEPPLFRPRLVAAALGHDGPLVGALAMATGQPGAAASQATLRNSTAPASAAPSQKGRSM
ncbi:N-acetylmannosamine kinase [Oceanicola granulosus HTCC2516]|uniref:N-acetylmannosamine kinase n=1 Tax=Oceanicola granulosus (strain ATCC BAA-861 / DSM 15982 / KCTC 12143 / HTCC2516) TaxID=314256 RepID=Q2CF03_OCEGH|nr:ROK family protein [Oceanicola granulosus]EAR51324.1 N-acetylmannosamine kinase [Oceanicola granulosus HTCC2516]